MSETVTRGKLFEYNQYRSHFADAQPNAVAWAWSDIVTGLAASRHGERGTFTLSKDGAAAGCEILPGMAVNVQVVQAGASTRPHAHAWWHLFVVQSGSGTAYLGADLPRVICCSCRRGATTHSSAIHTTRSSCSAPAICRSKPGSATRRPANP